MKYVVMFMKENLFQQISSVQYVRHQQASLLHRQEKENGLLSTLLA